MMASLGGLDYFGPSALRDAELQRAERVMRDCSNGVEDLTSPVVSCKSRAESSSGQDSNRMMSHSKSNRDNSSTMRSSRHSERSLEDSSEGVMIEERRRRADGDGHTTHRYVRGRMLGKGGFAKVYLCTSMDTGKNYAVKIVPKTNLVKARARQKLQTEIKIHRTLKHRNVCEYKHFFEDRDNCYILLELCHNQSLNEMIKRRKRFTEPEAAFFMSQLLDAVKYIHDENVIHRDLKLGNLFLDKDLNIKVGDLGLATRLEDKDEKRKTICGTPNYIAPEVIQNDKSKRGHSFEVDVWSMGVIMFTILVGKPPYEAKDVKGTYQRILANEYAFPSHVQLSADAMDLIQSMLKSDPKERPSLDTIQRHSFLNDLNRPEALPTTCLHSAPTWTRTEYGQLVSQDAVDSMKVKKTLSRQGSSRLPFSTHDANLASQKTGKADHLGKSQTKNQRPLQQTVRNVFPTPPCHPSTFKIYDETNNNIRYGEPADHTSSTRSATSVSSTENLVTKTKALTLDTARQILERSPLPAHTPRTCKTPSSAMTTPGHMGKDSEARFLETQLERLETVLEITERRKGQYRPLTPTSMRDGSLPDHWVTRYVDYTSKYGLGFLLNNGCSGVFFNDSTKIVLDNDDSSFQYVERKRTEFSELRRVDVLVGSHNMDIYPETLSKKVTLLKHFRNYLMEQQKKDGEDPEADKTSMASQGENLVYVKKWLRTKHAILFWLSSDVVQVVFFDQTEVMLTRDESSIVYVDKLNRRKSYGFTDEVIGSFPELEKRVKYARDVLKQLLTGQRS